MDTDIFDTKDIRNRKLPLIARGRMWLRPPPSSIISKHEKQEAFWVHKN
jgi:hypothetical protein